MGKAGIKINKEKLDAAINNSGYSRSKLSRIIGVSESYISNVVATKGTGLFDKDKLETLCLVLKIDESTIIEQGQAEDNSEQHSEMLEDIAMLLKEVIKRLKEDNEIQIRNEAKLAELLLEVQKSNTRMNTYFKNMENFRKFGHF